MNISITYDFNFESAHFIPEHPTCKNFHGHSYKGKATLTSPELTNNMVLDYHILKDIINKSIIEKVDHKLLNDIEGLEYPSAEIIAKWCYVKLKEALLVFDNIILVSLEINETEKTSAIVTE